jgi:hypothetical protein
MDVLAVLGIFALSFSLGLLGAWAVLGCVLYLMTPAPSRRQRLMVNATQPAASFLADDVGAATVRAA